jgi:hypothetical protein
VTAYKAGSDLDERCGFASGSEKRHTCTNDTMATVATSPGRTRMSPIYVLVAERQPYRCLQVATAVERPIVLPAGSAWKVVISVA